MNSSWQTFGHDKAKKILDMQVNAGRFPHAYLFFGPEGSGKRTLAVEFAQKILDTENVKSHPDFLLLDCGNEVSLEQVLEFVSQISFKPFTAQKRVAIINDAQNLNQASANALLKTLEETAPQTIIILISSARLLPTIVSRCQVFNFSALNSVELKNFAQQLGLVLEPEAYDLAFGNASMLKKFSQDVKVLEEQKQRARVYRQIQKAGFGERLVKIGELADLEAADLEASLELWANIQLSRLNQAPQEFPKVRVLHEAAQALRKNRNKKMVLQGLMTKI